MTGVLWFMNLMESVSLAIKLRVPSRESSIIGMKKLKSRRNAYDERRIQGETIKYIR